MLPIKVDHIGIIPDGARRWARKNGISYQESYQISMQKLLQVLDHLYQCGVQAISIYLLSSENLHRTPEELLPVFNSEENFISELVPSLVQAWKVKVVHAGNRTGIPASYLKAIDDLVTLSQREEQKVERKLFLLINYNPLDEIAYALVKSHGVEKLMQNLWVPEKLDLVIRTGSGQLLSNFLPLQAGYAELVFLDKLFNELEPEEIIKTIHTFCMQGNRLFGR